MGLFDWLKKKNVCNQTQENKPLERQATEDFSRKTSEDEQPSLEMFIKMHILLGAVCIRMKFLC